MAAPVEGPDLEHLAGGRERPRQQVLGEDLEAPRAALEARDEHEDRVGLRDRAAPPDGRRREVVAGVGGPVQVDAGAPELLEELRIRDDDAGRPGRLGGLRGARDGERLLRDDGARAAPVRGAVVEGVAVGAERVDAVRGEARPAARRAPRGSRRARSRRARRSGPGRAGTRPEPPQAFAAAFPIFATRFASAPFESAATEPSSVPSVRQRASSSGVPAPLGNGSFPPFKAPFAQLRELRERGVEEALRRAGHGALAAAGVGVAAGGGERVLREQVLADAGRRAPGREERRGHARDAEVRRLVGAALRDDPVELRGLPRDLPLRVAFEARTELVEAELRRAAPSPSPRGTPRPAPPAPRRPSRRPSRRRRCSAAAASTAECRRHRPSPAGRAPARPRGAARRGSEAVSRRASKGLPCRRRAAVHG